MESDELKEVDIEKRPCHYFDDIMRVHTKLLWV